MSKTRVILIILAAIIMMAATVWLANETAAYPGLEQPVSMSCCKCYRPLSDGSWFFEGVKEIMDCQSRGGTCRGEDRCFGGR
jgi:hypothetical protein